MCFLGRYITNARVTYPERRITKDNRILPGYDVAFTVRGVFVSVGNPGNDG